MNSFVHATAGALVGVGSYFVVKQALHEEPIPLGAFGFAAMGALAAGLPDYLEPATSARHRAFFHSIALVTALGYLLYRYIKGDKLNDKVLPILLAISASYGSHLALDALTPAGLPWA
jgi:inner membrane protein